MNATPCFFRNGIALTAKYARLHDEGHNVELSADLFELADLSQLFHVVVRLGMAALLGGILGMEREKVGKAAGLRTHMLVALGAALFTVSAVDAGMNAADLSRVFQGIAAGIGFIGAGAILKLTHEKEIKGLTTAATLGLPRRRARQSAPGTCGFRSSACCWRS